MTQLGEAVAIGTIDAAKHKKDVCPFCSEDPPPANATNDVDNSADRLRTACHAGDLLGHPEPVGANVWSVVYQMPNSSDQDISAVRSNPHHCIPGRGSLNGSSPHPIMDAIEKKRGVVTGDIGYNVNGRGNGIWLPTIVEHFYAGYRNVDPVAGIRWGRLTTQNPTLQFSLAEAAMFEAKRQFHDAHTDYSTHVSQRLDKLLDKLIARKQNCQEAGPKPKPDVPPPYGLVKWLDALSFAMASHLAADPRRWRDPIFTSRHAKAFHEKLNPPAP